MHSDRSDTALELADVSRRISRHRWLICACVGFGLVVAVLFHGTGAATYSATARLVLDTDPKSRSESISIADTGRAIATSPTQVRRALALAHVTGRNPLEVADNHVSVSAVGASAVLRLSVSDPDPNVAAAVANALAGRVIQTRLDVSNGQVQQLLGEADRAILALSEKIANADADLEELNTSIASQPSDLAARFRSQRDAKLRQRDFLAQQRSVLESERATLLSAAALRPKPSIISRATPPQRRDPSGLLPDLILGVALGLILGIGLAGLREVLSPTLVGGDAISRAFDAPFLGTLGGGADSRGYAEAATAARLRLASEGRGVNRVVFIPADEHLEVELSMRLEGALSNGSRLASPGGHEPLGQLPSERLSVVSARVLAAEGLLASNDAESAGLVLVSPETVRKSQIAEVSSLLRMTSLPLLGVVAYRAPHRLRTTEAGRGLLRVWRLIGAGRTG